MKTNMESINSGKYTKSVAWVQSCQNVIYHNGRSKWKNGQSSFSHSDNIIDLRSPKYICYKII